MKKKQNTKQHNMIIEQPSANMKTNNQIIEKTTPAIMQDEATALISQAIEKNVPMETMEKLLAMRRELRQEKAKEEYDKAMAAFQSKCPTIEKRKQGYNYKYADLTAIVEQIKGLLSENGFSYTFDTDEAENGIIIYCKVKHIAGHTEVSKARIDKETTTKMNASQQAGSVMTYGKRYAFCNALGILTGDEDTDATTNHTEKPVVHQPMQQIRGGSTEAADIYAGKSLGKLKMELAHLIQQGKSKVEFRELNGISREDVIKKIRETESKNE